MSVIENFATISQTITKLMSFITENENALSDFQNYLESVTQDNGNKNEIADTALFNFMLAGRIGDENIRFVEYYLKENPKTSLEEKKIIKAIGSAITSFFEIKKVLKNSFDVYNLINENEYSVMPLVKMSHFRGLYAQQYIVATIIKYENEYYLLEIREVYSQSEKAEVYKMAIASMIERPQLFYEDNSKKLIRLQKIVPEMYDKFIDCFGSDEIITTNVYTDELMEFFDKHCQTSVSADEKKEILAKIVVPKEFRFFDVEDLNNFYDDFLEKSLNGFSSHSAQYDVGIVYDKEYGLYIIPFYATVSRIFEIENYQEIEGYKECMMNFLNNTSIPPTFLHRLAHKYNNFEKIINDILGKEYTLEKLIEEYKFEYLENKIFSSTSILYESKLFSATLELMEKTPADEQSDELLVKVGRNELCPCGSGKKFKKCCMNKL